VTSGPTWATLDSAPKWVNEWMIHM
jgi:hypothetical protein